MMSNRESIARAIHAADETYCHEPWDDVKGSYRTMADAAIAAMQDQWQTIETAPTDGTRIIVYTYTGVTETAWFCERTGLWPHDEVYADDGEPCNVGWPTHWMPLPPAPEAAL